MSSKHLLGKPIFWQGGGDDKQASGQVAHDITVPKGLVADVVHVVEVVIHDNSLWITGLHT